MGNFAKYADLIIDKIEGGYYHPTRHYSEAMGDSGETMFGIDRKNGGSDIKDSEAGRKFWALIDANAANWKRGYRGGSLENQLKQLALKMMYDRYTRYSNSYLTAEARKQVFKSPKLETHFFYACWNGPGRFQNFAKEINSAVAAGQSLTQLEQTALNSRLNSSVSLIRTGGAILRDRIWPELGNGGGGWLWWLLAAGVGIYFLTKKS